jgi:hypothetical protein
VHPPQVVKITGHVRSYAQDGRTGFSLSAFDFRGDGSQFPAVYAQPEINHACPNKKICSLIAPARYISTQPQNARADRLHRRQKKSAEAVLVAQALLPARVLQSAHSQPLAGARDKEWLCYLTFPQPAKPVLP